MSYESRAYDEPARDGFGPEPVVVLVVKGSHDVSRLVHLFAGGVNTVEQIEVGKRIARQVSRDEGGRAALKLLAEHGGPDFTPPPLPGVTDWILEVVRRIAAGRQMKQIAREMSLSPSGIAMPLLRLRNRLGLTSNDQLVALFVHRGLVDPPEVSL